MLAELSNSRSMPRYFKLQELVNMIVSTVREANKEVVEISTAIIPSSVEMTSWLGALPKVMPAHTRFEVYTIGGCELVWSSDVSFKTKAYVKWKRMNLVHKWEGYEVYLVVESAASNYEPYEE